MERLPGPLELARPLIVRGLDPRVEYEPIGILCRIYGCDVGPPQDLLPVHGPSNEVLAPLDLVRMESFGSVKAQWDPAWTLLRPLPDIEPDHSGVYPCELDVDLRYTVHDQEEASDVTVHVGRDYVDRVDTVLGWLIVDEFAA